MSLCLWCFVRDASVGSHGDTTLQLMRTCLTLVFLIPCLFACDRLSDDEVKALKCKLWRQDGGVLNKQIYKDITNKNKCVITNDFRESLALQGRKGISMPCDPNEQDSLLQEVNSICDSLLDQN